MTKKKTAQKPEDMDIQTAAKLGRLKQFKNLLQKIKSGKASSADMRTFKDLERELSRDDEDQESTTPAKLTGPEATQYLGISRRMLSYHTTKGNLKANADNTYNRAELDRWAAKYGRKSNRPAPPGNGSDTPQTVGEAKDAADLRYKLARAEREELVTAQLKGSLYGKEDVEQALREIITTTKKAVLLLPRTLPTVLHGKKQAAQLDAIALAVDEILTGLERQATIKAIENRILK